MFNDESLESFYRTNFEVTTNYNTTLTELYAMHPYERDVWISLIIEHQEELKNASK
jgi:hypothetical protein